MEPMKLEEWIEQNLSKADTRKAKRVQVVAEYVQKILPFVFNPSYKEGEPSGCEVVNTVQLSVELPLYRFMLPNGVEIKLYNDFYEWHVSVNSPEEIEVDPARLFAPKHAADKKYSNETLEEKYGPYSESKRQFSFELPSDLIAPFKLFMVLWELAVAMGLRETNEDPDQALISM